MSATKHDRAGTGAQEAFQARMGVQCQQIQRYRLEVLRNEGRLLSQNEAAQQWIERYAEYFVQGGDASNHEVIVTR